MSGFNLPVTGTSPQPPLGSYSVSVGEELVCVAELTDGTFHVGLDSATLILGAALQEISSGLG